jgi:hypothetical protein
MMSDMWPPTFVYVARMGDFIKIGASRDVRKRLRDLERCVPGTLMPDEVIGHAVSLITTFETTDALSLERALHDAFAPQRAIGEWFKLDEQLAHWCARRQPRPWWDSERDYDDNPLVEF